MPSKSDCRPFSFLIALFSCRFGQRWFPFMRCETATVVQLVRASMSSHLEAEVGAPLKPVTNLFQFFDRSIRRNIIMNCQRDPTITQALIQSDLSEASYAPKTYIRGLVMISYHQSATMTVSLIRLGFRQDGQHNSLRLLTASIISFRATFFFFLFQRCLFALRRS
jgi:hypothetical protein